MSHANPPRQKIPKKILDDPELKAFFEDMVRVQFLLWKLVGIDIEVSGNVGLYGTAPVDQAAAMSAALSSLTHTDPSTPDYALQDLVDSASGSAFGFATKDEGNSVLKAIVNLQTRVNELEAGLDSSTGVGIFT